MLGLSSSIPPFYSPDLGRILPRYDKPKKSCSCLRVAVAMVPFWINVCRQCYPVCCSVELKCWLFTCWAPPDLLSFLTGAPFVGAACGGPALSLSCTVLLKWYCAYQVPWLAAKRAPQGPSDSQVALRLSCSLIPQLPRAGAAWAECNVCSRSWAGGAAQSQV